MENSITPLTAAYVRWLSSFRATPLGDARPAHTRHRAANDPQMLVHLEWDDEEEPVGTRHRPGPMQ